MSSEHDPNLLNKEATIGINQALYEAINDIDCEIESEGFWELYRSEFNSLDPELRILMRRVVSGIYPFQLSDQQLPLHPRALALEAGLTIGLAMGYRALEGGVEGEEQAFEEAFARDLSAMYEFTHQTRGSQHKFGALLRHSGKQMISYIRDIASPNLIMPFRQHQNALTNTANNLVFVSAVGYVLSEATSIMAYDAIYRQQHADESVEEALVASIGEVEGLGDVMDEYIPAWQLFPDLFPEPLPEN